LSHLVLPILRVALRFFAGGMVHTRRLGFYIGRN
jgi:hypothetical protein